MELIKDYQMKEIVKNNYCFKTSYRVSLDSMNSNIIKISYSLYSKDYSYYWGESYVSNEQIRKCERTI